MALREVFENPWVRAAGLLLALAGVALLIYLLSPVLVSLFMAFLFAYLMNPVVDWLERRRIPREAAIAALAVAALLVAVGLPLLVIPGVISHADGLIRAAQEAGAEEDAAVWYERWLDALPLEEWVRKLGWEEEGMDARAVLAERIGTYVREHALQFVQGNMAALSRTGQWAGATVAGFLASLGQRTLAFVVFLANFALFAFVAGYLLKDYHRLLEGGRELIPPRYRERALDILAKVDRQLRSFVRGQLTVCLCLGLMYAVGMTICGVPFGFLLAVFGAAVSFVPFLGVALTVGPALLLTVLQHGLGWQAVGVIVTFTVAQTVESNVLTPRVVGKEVGLHPVWVILAVLVFGSALGFLGLLLAVPMAASLKVLVEELVEYYRRSPLFGED